MKLANAPQDVAIQGDFETSDFNLGDVAFVVDLFADKIYTNKVRAVLRELSCNAHDAHMAANTTDIPFDVHLPTKLEPYFTIRDYGTGLSDADVRSIFCGIGISTKRDSNDFIGAFGIGSLSPYSLGDSFTVRSYYNGIMRTYNCYRDNLRKPKVALLTEVETDEQNGLEISVNVEPEVKYSGNTDWADEAVFVYRHWKGTSFALNDGTVVEKLQERQYKVKGDFYGFTGDYGTLYAVMGNIAYDMSDIAFVNDWRSSAGYIEFEMGELDFDTARENLSITDKTKAAVEAKLEKVKECAAADIEAHIESLPTQWDRAVYCERLPHRLSRFVKSSVLDSYKLPSCSTDMVYYNSSGKGTSHRLYLSKGTRYFLDKRGYVGRIKAAAKEARETFFVLTQEQADEMMVPAEMLEDLETLPKVYRSNGTARAAGSNIKVFTFNHDGSRWGREAKSYWVESMLPPATPADEIVYMEISRWCPDKVETYPNKPLARANTNAGIRNIQEDLHYFGIQEPVIVGLKSAFCRSKAFTESDKYIRYEDWLHREINRVAQESDFVVQDYKSDDLKRIKAIAEYVQSDELDKILSYTNHDELVVYLTRAADIWGIKFETESSTKLQESMDNFLDKYGMLRYISEYEIDDCSKQDIANYINGTIKGNDNNG